MKILKVLRSIPARAWTVITKPERFFKKIILDGSLEESMIKAALYGFFGAIAVLLIDALGAYSPSVASVVATLILHPVFAVAVLFVFAGLLMLFSEITGGNRDWEMAVKGVSSIFFMYPVILILGALAPGSPLGRILGLVADAYILFLLYNIAYHCMGGKRWAVLACVGVAAASLIAIHSGGYGVSWMGFNSPAVVHGCA